MKLPEPGTPAYAWRLAEMEHLAALTAFVSKSNLIQVYQGLEGISWHTPKGLHPPIADAVINRAQSELRALALKLFPSES